MIFEIRNTKSFFFLYFKIYFHLLKFSNLVLEKEIKLFQITVLHSELNFVIVLFEMLKITNTHHLHSFHTHTHHTFYNTTHIYRFSNLSENTTFSDFFLLLEDIKYNKNGLYNKTQFFKIILPSVPNIKIWGIILILFQLLPESVPKLFCDL